MRPVSQVLVCLVWIVLVFYWTTRPPMPPPSFPENDALSPSREVYNPGLAAALDQGLRDFWQKPDQVLDALGDLEGLTVADIGAGEGYFTLRLLDRVGPSGMVYANDIQPSVLEALNERIPTEFRNRVQLILGQEDRTRITAPVDLILLIQVFGEVANQRTFLQHLSTLMHEDSRLVIIDSKHVTDPESGFTRPLDLQRLMTELNQEGFVHARDHNPADFDFLPKQFFFVLERRDL